MYSTKTTHSRWSAAVLLVSLIEFQSSLVWGQADPQPVTTANVDAASIVIADEPQSIDPATLLPAQLVTKVTVKFDGQPLKEVIDWLKRNCSLSVVVDYKALAANKLLETEPVYEDIKEAPLYLVLNHLQTLGLGWYVQDNNLQITSSEESQKLGRTIPYNLGDLIDTGYLPAELRQTIVRCSGGHWDEGRTSSNSGSAVLIGDVLFVRQQDNIHREIQGLLAALRKHGRRTYTLESPRHAALRAMVDQKISVDFLDTPLVVAVQELATKVGVGIRLDRASLAKANVREKTPITLKMADQKLSDVFQSLLAKHNLTWYVRDEVIWVSSLATARGILKTAVFDVRDLCADKNEANSLKSVLLTQLYSDFSGQTESPASIEVPRPGVLVVRNTDRTLDEILQLLENYRQALSVSVRRAKVELDPNEMITGYYRLPAQMAIDTRTLIMGSIQPESWKSDNQPNARGTVTFVTAEPTVTDARGNVTTQKTAQIPTGLVLIENRVLVIHQTRAIHRSIGKLIRSLLDSKTIDPTATAESPREPDDVTIQFGRRLLGTKRP